MRKFSTILIFIFFVNFLAWSQDVEQEASKTGKVSTTYDRNAITVVVLDNNNKFIGDLKTATAGIEIPGKFDDNQVATRYISAKANAKSIEKAIKDNKVPNEIIAKWFARDESGKMDMRIIHERGMYNATDDEIRKASGSKIGLAKIKDAGETLVNHSYILVLKFDNIESVEDKYAKQDVAKKALAEKMGTDYEPVKRRKNGWEGDVTGYLYKLSFKDSIMDVFYNDLWIYEEDDEATIAAKKQKFDEMVFPVSFVMEGEGSADGSQYNAGEILAPPKQLSREELFQKMINTGINAIIFDAERKVEDFRVKTPLYSADPLKSKIGKKEGVSTEQRFFVYEFVQKNNGEKKAKKKGVVRARHVVDNRQVATGNSELYTTFYQTAGFGLMSGMLLQQRNDFGIGISVNYAVMGEIGGINGKLEANLGILAGRFLNADLGATQLKLYGVFGSQTKEYTIPSNIEGGGNPYDDFSFGRFSVGLSKGWYFARNFSIAPFVGYGMETAKSEKWSDSSPNLADSASIGTDFIHLGTYATINITHWMQLMGTVNIYAPFGDAYDDNRDALNDLNGNTYKYTDVFDKRSGLSVELGVRIEF